MGHQHRPHACMYMYTHIRIINDDFTFLHYFTQESPTASVKFTKLTTSMATSSHRHALLLCHVCALLSMCANADTIYHDLIFSRKFVSPDGFEKSALVVNGELIGPSIEAYVGDTIVVNVTNMGEC